MVSPLESTEEGQQELLCVLCTRKGATGSGQLLALPMVLQGFPRLAWSS